MVIQYSTQIFDKVNEINLSINSISGIMLQSTGSKEDTPATFYNSIGVKGYAHFVVGKDSIYKYAYSTSAVINPSCNFTQRATSLLSGNMAFDTPATHLIVVEICLDNYTEVEKNLISFLVDYLTQHNLTTDNLFRYSDIIDDGTDNPRQYGGDYWKKLLDEVNRCLDLKKNNTAYTPDPTGASPDNSSSSFTDDFRNITHVSSADKSTLVNDDSVPSGTGDSSIRVDNFTNTTIVSVSPEDEKFEPVYPDYTPAPRGTTKLYDGKIDKVDSLLKAKKTVVGSIVNFNDPYPVDSKIFELESHYPKVKIEKDEIGLDDEDSEDSTLKSFIYLTSLKSEKRIIRLENVLSTIMRYIFRCGSRMCINCIYYGGQASYDKYQCIRCLNDDMTMDGAIVSIDQCLNCSRYEPIIGQVYDVVDKDKLQSQAMMLDNIMSSRFSNDEYVNDLKITGMNKTPKDAEIDTSTLSKKQNTSKDFKDTKRYDNFKMDWAETALPQEPYVIAYEYSPDTIFANKDAILKDPMKSGYDASKKIVFNTNFADMSDLSDPGESYARNAIIKRAKDLIAMCQAGKAVYELCPSYTSNGILHHMCASFAYDCYSAAKVQGSMPKNLCADQERYCSEGGMVFTDASKLKLGDLVFYKEGGPTIGHVAVYSGANKIMAASYHHKDDPTKDFNEQSIKGPGEPCCYGRTKELVEADKQEETLNKNTSKMASYMDIGYQAIPDSLKSAGESMASRADATAKNMQQYGYKDTLKELCSRSNLDPYLILGIIAVESNGNPSAGAGGTYVGLMQVAGASVNAGSNIQEGINTLESKLKCVSNNMALAIYAYNAGQLIVMNALKALNIPSSQWSFVKGGTIAEQMGIEGRSYYHSSGKYSECREYFTKVLYAYNYLAKKKLF